MATQSNLTISQRNKSSAVAEMGDLGHNRQGPKRGGGAAEPLSRAVRTPSNTMWPGRRSTSVPSGVVIHPAVWPQRTLAENWAAVPLQGRGAGFPAYERAEKKKEIKKERNKTKI